MGGGADKGKIACDKDVAFGVNQEFGMGAVGVSDDIAVSHGRRRIDVHGGVSKVGETWPGARMSLGGVSGGFELAGERAGADDGQLIGQRGCADADIAKDKEWQVPQTLDNFSLLVIL